MDEINILKLAEDENNRLILRNNLRYIRKYLDLSDGQLGDMIGVTRQTVNNFENKKCVITKYYYMAIFCAILSIIDSSDKEIIYKMLTKEITFMKYDVNFKD